MKFDSLGRKADVESLAVVPVVLCTVVTSLVISAITFIIGVMCGHYFGRKPKHDKSKEISDHQPKSIQPVPLYEPVLPSAMEHQEQDLELKENMAYGPSKLICKLEH